MDRTLKKPSSSAIVHPSPEQGIGMTSARTRARMIDRLRQQRIHDPRVLAILGRLPRHLFVEEALASRAYEDTSLPLGLGQTISQPYTVARMSELLCAGPPLKRVLEIGTGCGYQTAVLSALAEEVYSIERLEALHLRAQVTLAALNIQNAVLRYGDGCFGWPEVAPFDGIIMTAAAPKLAETLLTQLAVGGRMVLPLGEQDQMLWLITRTPEGLTRIAIEPVRFVPLLSGLA